MLNFKVYQIVRLLLLHGYMFSTLNATAGLKLYCSNYLTKKLTPSLRNSYKQNKFLKINSAVSGEVLTLEALSALITQNDFNPSEILMSLPADFQSNPILNYSSQSTQSGTLLNPRIILSNSDASGIITFPGDVYNAQFETIEHVIFDQVAKRYIPSEIKYDPVQRKILKIDHDSNKCAACHGHPFRPIWESYPFWPGIYGSQAHPQGYSYSDAQNFSHMVATKEEKYFNKFLLGPSMRYKFLEKTLLELYNLGQINTAFSAALQFHNLITFEAKIEKHERYQDYKMILLLCLENLSLPRQEALGGTVLSTYVPNYQNEIHALFEKFKFEIERDHQFKLNQLFESVGLPQLKDRAASYEELRMLEPSQDIQTREKTAKKLANLMLVLKLLDLPLSDLSLSHIPTPAQPREFPMTYDSPDTHNGIWGKLHDLLRE
jgi:hypothetical protein